MSRDQIDDEDGVYRVRRGKVVRVPDEWVGKIPHDQTVRKRKSHQTKHQRDNAGRVLKDGSFDWKNRGRHRYDMLDEDA